MDQNVFCYLVSQDKKVYENLLV